MSSPARMLLRAIPPALTLPGLLLLACASSAPDESLQWHAVDPDRDAIPYIVDETSPRPVAVAAAIPAEPPASPAADAAPARRAPGAPVAPSPPAEPDEALEIPAPIEPSAGPTASAAPAAAPRIVEVPGEPPVLPLPETPTPSDADLAEDRLVPTGDEAPLELVRDPDLDAPSPATVGPAAPPIDPVPRSAADAVVPETWNDSVVARVNGAPILFSELKEFAIEENLPLAGLTADGLRGEAFRRAMTARVDQTLLIQAANLESLEADQLEVSRRVDAFIAQRIDEAGGRAEFIQALRGSQLNLESFRALLMKRETQRQLAAGIVSRRVTIGTDELEAFKKQRRENAEPLEEVQLAQILVACPAADQQTEFGRQQFRRALEIAARAARQPAAFSKIVAEINSDPAGRERGGLLGWIDPTTLQPSIAGTVATMRDGEVSEPVASDAGFHVLFVLDRRDARDMLYSRKFEEERSRLIEELRAKAQIEIYPLEGAG